MTLQNVKNIKGCANKNGLKTLCVNKALMTLIATEKYQNQGLTGADLGFCPGEGKELVEPKFANVATFILSCNLPLIALFHTI